MKRIFQFKLYHKLKIIEIQRAINLHVLCYNSLSQINFVVIKPSIAHSICIQMQFRLKRKRERGLKRIISKYFKGSKSNFSNNRYKIKIISIFIQKMKTASMTPSGRALIRLQCMPCIHKGSLQRFYKNQKKIEWRNALAKILFV